MPTYPSDSSSSVSSRSPTQLQIPHSQLRSLSIGDRRSTSSQFHYYPLEHVPPHTHVRSPVVCQTPWLWLPYAPRYVQRPRRRVHFFHLEFPDASDNAAQRSWLQFLRRMQKALAKYVQRAHRLRRRRGLHTADDTPRSLQWMNVLEEENVEARYAFLSAPALAPASAPASAPTPRASHTTSCARWKISTHFSPQLQCFDSAQHAIPLNTFIAPATFQPKWVRLLVQFTNVWVNEQAGTAGVAVNVLQLQQSEIAPFHHFAFVHTLSKTDAPHHPPSTATVAVQTDPCQFEGGTGDRGIGDARTDTSNASHAAVPDTSRHDHPVYGKYFKMCAKGVPKPAVQHKMRMNGVDPAVLDLPPGKPLPEVGGGSSGNGSDALSLSLQDTQQLRKTEVNANRDQKGSSGAGHGFSLNEIVSGLRSLRKTLWGGSKKDTESAAAAVSPMTSSTVSSANRLTVVSPPSPHVQLMQMLQSKYNAT